MYHDVVDTDGGVLKVCSIECTVSPSELRSKLSPSSWMLQFKIACTGEAATANSSASALALLVGVYFMVRDGLDKRWRGFFTRMVVRSESEKEREKIKLVEEGQL
jgi:hypothetical protein